jgi:hypothetical protein
MLDKQLLMEYLKDVIDEYNTYNSSGSRIVAREFRILIKAIEKGEFSALDNFKEVLKALEDDESLIPNNEIRDMVLDAMHGKEGRS